MDIPENVLNILESIAKSGLRVETLQSRNRDSLDFYDLSVVSLREALYKAWQAGYDQGWQDSEDTWVNVL